MITEYQIRKQLALYIFGLCSLGDFKDWLIPFYREMHRNGSEDSAQDLAVEVGRHIGRYSGSYIEEAQLRLNLIDLLSEVPTGKDKCIVYKRVGMKLNSLKEPTAKSIDWQCTAEECRSKPLRKHQVHCDNCGWRGLFRSTHASPFLVQCPDCGCSTVETNKISTALLHESRAGRHVIARSFRY